MLLYGRYVHPSLERVLGEDRSVQQAQFDLLSRTSGGGEIRSHQAQGQGRSGRNIEKSSGNGLFVLDLHE